MIYLRKIYCDNRIEYTPVSKNEFVTFCSVCGKQFRLEDKDLIDAIKGENFEKYVCLKCTKKDAPKSAN
ncbi:hypothetical protein DWW36_12140 [Erysipelotrichaceae bacterium AF15-26LB]|nr:hypothetical protein DWW36_12140 [Erysipelotrichaceae bacterium AF15-26LB]